MGGRAGERSEIIRKLIKDRFHAELRTVTPEQMVKVRQMQFAGARLLFSQNQFKEAAEKYLLVLSSFPSPRRRLPRWATWRSAISSLPTRILTRCCWPTP